MPVRARQLKVYYKLLIMKNKLFVRELQLFCLGIALLFASAALGQVQQTSTESGLKAKFGIKGGFDLTSLYISDVSSEHMKPGFDAGIFAKLPVTKAFSIQPELLYRLKGAKDNYSNFLQGSGEYQFNLGYVQLPVLAVVN